MSAAGAEGRVVTSRIVVFGPAGAGTTTTLETIWRRLRADQRGQIVRQTLPADAAAGYEVLPVDLGDVNGLHRRVQLATVPRGAANVGSRRQLLKGVDGVIFVADSAPDRAKETVGAMRELGEHMSAYGRALAALPMVILLNKRDLPGATPAEQIVKPLLDRLEGKRPPVFEAVATDGRGILNALSAVAKLVVAGAVAPVASQAVPNASHRSAKPVATKPLPAGALPGAPHSPVSVGAPRAVPGGVQVPLVVEDARGGQHRLTLTLRIDPTPAGGGAR